jgi:hypothetical protein
VPPAKRLPDIASDNIYYVNQDAGAIYSHSFKPADIFSPGASQTLCKRSSV